MPTDDVNPADETPRETGSSAADESAPSPLRAMSLSDLEPEEEKPRRLTRREARARREARKNDEKASLPTSTPVGGAFRSTDEAAPTSQQAPDERARPQTRGGARIAGWMVPRDDSAPAPSGEPPAAAPSPPEAEEIDDDTRANPIAATPEPAEAPAEREAPDPREDGAAEAEPGDALHSGPIETATGLFAAVGETRQAGDEAPSPSSEAADAAEAPDTRSADAGSAEEAPADGEGIAEDERDVDLPGEPTVAMPMPAARATTADPSDPLSSENAAPEATEIDPEGGDDDDADPPASPSVPALAWLSAEAVAANDASPLPHRPDTEPEPLVRRRRRSPWPLIAPILTAIVLAIAYIVGCAVWPLDHLDPRVTQAEIKSPEGAELEPDWPADGGAAIAAVGQIDDVPASSDDARPMASITKLVSLLMVLDEEPLKPGDDGPSYDFTVDDLNNYYGYVYRGESRLEVPVDGSLTEYEMLQGILLGSANNYIDKLVTETFGSAEEFAAQTPDWLKKHGLDTMTVVQPSGIDWNNTASPADVARLGVLALSNPVIAEIVQQKKADLPGVGTVENSNPLLGDKGVVGIKTGTLLNNANLVVAKEVEVDGETVTVVASILGQPDDTSRDIVARSLLDQATKAAKKTTVVVPEKTTVATVTTAWGESAEIVTPEDLSLPLWNGDSAEIGTELTDVLGRDKGDEVGTLTAAGSFGDGTVTLQLTDAVDGPTIGWRLAHPLALLGLQ